MPDTRTKWARQSAGGLAGAAYDFCVEREWMARPAGRLLWGTDTALLFDNLNVAARVPGSAAILDVPCGGGLALRGVRAGHEGRYVAADISPAMLARARRRASRLGLGRVEFVNADITDLPFPDGGFDLCVSFNGLHCLSAPADGVAELTRCLVPGGRLVGDSVVRGAGKRYDRTCDLLRRLGYFGATGTAAELERWLHSAGLRIDRFERSGALVHFAGTRDA